MSLEIKSGTDEINVSSVTIGLKNAKCAAGVSLQSFTPQQISQMVHELSALAWISVDDELPKENGEYQVKTKSGKVEIQEYLDCSGFDYGNVTHWQPLAKV